MSFFSIIAGAAVVLGAVTSWPQAWRAWRHGVTGVSPLAVGCGISTMAAWSAYTARSADWPALGATLCVAAGWILTMCALVRRDAIGISGAGAAFAAGAATLGLLWLPPVAVAGYVAMAGSLVWVVPQAWRARRGDLDGVSVHAWALLVAECATWIVYGVLAGHWVYIPGSAWQVLVAGYVAVRAAANHRAVAG